MSGGRSFTSVSVALALAVAFAIASMQAAGTAPKQPKIGVPPGGFVHEENARAALGGRASRILQNPATAKPRCTATAPHTGHSLKTLPCGPRMLGDDQSYRRWTTANRARPAGAAAPPGGVDITAIDGMFLAGRHRASLPGRSAVPAPLCHEARFARASCQAQCTKAAPRARRAGSSGETRARSGELPESIAFAHRYPWPFRAAGGHPGGTC